MAQVISVAILALALLWVVQKSHERAERREKQRLIQKWLELRMIEDIRERTRL